MKTGSTVKVVDHPGYADIHNVGGVGEVCKLEEKKVWVKFDGQEEDVEYPIDLVQELTEEEQAQLKGEGKDGMPDTSQPKPPEVKSEEMGDLEGAQKQVAQASGGGERPGGKAPEVTSDQVVLKGEQSQVEQPAGGPERPTGSGQSAGVGSQQLVMQGQQPQLTGAGSRTESTRPKKKPVKEGAFRPITVNVLEQGDKDDEYVTLGEGSSIRSEHHLMASVRSAIRKAMESMEKPFDIVDVVFRRAPVQEEKRRKAERALMATLHLLDEGKAKSADVRKAAWEAARVGVRTDRLAEYTEDRYAKKILEDAIKEQGVGGAPKMIWPPKELAKHVGSHVIVETRVGDRLVGTLSKGPGRMFNVKTRSGTHKFSTADVTRILIKPGAK